MTFQVGFDTIPGCFLLHFQTIRKLILNCASSYVFFTQNIMFTVAFFTHDTPGKITLIIVIYYNIWKVSLQTYKKVKRIPPLVVWLNVGFFLPSLVISSIGSFLAQICSVDIKLEKSPAGSLSALGKLRYMGT